MNSTIKGNGWILVVSQEWIRIVSSDPREPDPKWSFVDAALHGHRYFPDAEHYPTLVSRTGEPYWCSDCRDEHVDSWLACRLCDESIFPGTRSVNPVSFVNGPVNSTLTLEMELSDADLAAVKTAFNADNSIDAQGIFTALGKEPEEVG